MAIQEFARHNNFIGNSARKHNLYVSPVISQQQKHLLVCACTTEKE